MKLPDSKCIFCKDNNVVISDSHKEILLDIVKKVYFVNNKDDFQKFNKQIENKSICTACAYKLEVMKKTMTLHKLGLKQKKTVNKHTCSICFAKKNDQILSPIPENSSMLYEGFLSAGKKYKTVCLRCSFALITWKKLRSNLQLGYVESDNSSVVESGSDNSKKSEKRNGQKRKFVSTEENEGNDVRLAKRLKFNKDESEVPQTSMNTRSKSTPRRSTNVIGKPSTTILTRGRKEMSADLTKKLSHLKTVDKETLKRNMHLSYDVLIDKKMMFSIPYVSFGKNDTIQVVDPEVIVLSSEESDKEILFERNKSKRGRKRIITPSSSLDSEGNYKQPKQSPEPGYVCDWCSDRFFSNVSYKLHTLEHVTSFSPVVCLEQGSFTTENSKDVSDTSGESITLNDKAGTDTDSFHSDSGEVTDTSKAAETQTSEIPNRESLGELESIKSNSEDEEIKSNSESQDDIEDQQNVQLRMENKTKKLRYTEEDIDKVLRKYLNTDEQEKEAKQVPATNNDKKPRRRKPGPKSRRKPEEKLENGENEEKKVENAENTHLDEASQQENISEKVTGNAKNRMQETDDEIVRVVRTDKDVEIVDNQVTSDDEVKKDDKVIEINTNEEKTNEKEVEVVNKKVTTHDEINEIVDNQVTSDDEVKKDDKEMEINTNEVKTNEKEVEVVNKKVTKDDEVRNDDENVEINNKEVINGEVKNNEEVEIDGKEVTNDEVQNNDQEIGILDKEGTNDDEEKNDDIEVKNDDKEVKTDANEGNNDEKEIKNDKKEIESDQEINNDDKNVNNDDKQVAIGDKELTSSDEVKNDKELEIDDKVATSDDEVKINDTEIEIDNDVTNYEPDVEIDDTEVTSDEGKNDDQEVKSCDKKVNNDNEEVKDDENKIKNVDKEVNNDDNEIENDEIEEIDDKELTSDEEVKNVDKEINNDDNEIENDEVEEIDDKELTSDEEVKNVDQEVDILDKKEASDGALEVDESLVQTDDKVLETQTEVIETEVITFELDECEGNFDIVEEETQLEETEEKSTAGTNDDEDVEVGTKEDIVEEETQLEETEEQTTAETNDDEDVEVGTKEDSVDSSDSSPSDSQMNNEQRKSKDLKEKVVKPQQKTDSDAESITVRSQKSESRAAGKQGNSKETKQVSLDNNFKKVEDMLANLGA